MIVPVPEAYALHKMVINSQHGAKAHKDARAVANLQPYLNTTVFKSLYEQLTKKERLRFATLPNAKESAFKTDLASHMRKRDVRGIYIVGCPYPVESAHPSRKEAP